MPRQHTKLPRLPNATLAIATSAAATSARRQLSSATWKQATSLSATSSRRHVSSADLSLVPRQLYVSSSVPRVLLQRHVSKHWSLQVSSLLSLLSLSYLYSSCLLFACHVSRSDTNVKTLPKITRVRGTMHKIHTHGSTSYGGGGRRKVGGRRHHRQDGLLVANRGRPVAALCAHSKNVQSEMTRKTD
jgi:hypothetical protein